MSNKKVRSGHRTWLTKVFDGVDECLQSEYTISRKTELLKWKVSIKEHLERILMLDDLLRELSPKSSLRRPPSIALLRDRLREPVLVSDQL